MMQQAEGFAVLEKDSAACESALTSAIEAYIRADVSTYVNLRRRYRELVRETGNAMQFHVQSSVAGGQVVSDACYQPIAKAMNEFVLRHRSDPRDRYDAKLATVLDECVAKELKRFAGSFYVGMPEAEIVMQCLERYVGESGKPLESFASLNRCVEWWCEDKWHQ
jgi:hypothetical protein